MTAAFILTGMRVPKERLSGIYSGVTIMHKTTAWDSAVDEGVLKGGLKMLLSIGREHLGEPDSKVKTALAAIQDVERLERMGAAILRVKSWQALLGVK